MENCLRIIGGNKPELGFKVSLKDLAGLLFDRGIIYLGIGITSEPCGKCPYFLGKIKTPSDPCPKCRSTGYSAYYEWVKDK